jgi:hypothetical protein
MRVNYYLAQYHFFEKHSIIMISTPEKVIEAIKTLLIFFPA